VGPEVPEELEDSDFRTLFVDAHFRYTKHVPYGDEGARTEHLQLTYFDYAGEIASSEGSATSDTSESSESSDTIEELGSSESGLRFDIALQWAGAEVFFDSRTAPSDQVIFSSNAWGNWTILEWVYLRDIDDPADFDRVVRVVIETARLSSFTYPIRPDETYFAPGLINHSSSRVATLRFINHSGTEHMVPDPTLISPSGDVTLVAGYNTDIATATDPVTTFLDQGVDVRPANRISLDFSPGSGRGLYPGCVEPDTGILRINSVGPDVNGHFRLGAEGCYWWERQWVDEVPRCPEGVGLEVVKGASLRFNNWCTPCCSCDDYVDSYSKLRDAWEILNEAAETYDALKDEVQRLINALDTSCASGCDKVIPHIISYMKHSWLLTGQGIIYNVTEKDLLSFDISLNLISPFVGYAYVPNSAWFVTPESDRRVSDAAGYTQRISMGERVAAATCVIFEYEVYFPEQGSRLAGMPVMWVLHGHAGLGDDRYEFYTTAMDYLQGPFNH